jgi:hypothetical protein
VPLDAFAKIEGDRFAAVFDGPPLGQIADEFDVLIVLHEPVEDLVVDLAR